MLDIAPDTLARVAAEAGFDGIGLRWSADHRLDGPALQRMASTLDDLGLRLHDVEVHRIGPDASDPAPLIDAAARLGAQFVLVVSDHRADAEGSAATEDALGDFSTACRRAGLVAGLEYMAWTVPNSSVEAVRMAATTDCMVLVDLLHHHRLGEGAAALAHVASSGRLGWVQLCDAPDRSPGDLLDEARHHRLPPGEGGLPLRELLGEVPAGVPISVEVQSDELARRLPAHERALVLRRAASAVLGE